MEDEQIAPHVKDITRALENKVSEDEIQRELHSYLNVYRVPLETAKRSIVKKHGGNPASLTLGVEKKLEELMANEPSVNFLARVVSINEREIETDGGRKRIFYGILGDETRTLPFTAWEVEGLELEKGDVIFVRNAYTREFREEVQLNFGIRTAIEKVDKDALPPYQPKPTAANPVKIGDLRGGMSNVSIKGRVISMEKREVEVDGEEKVVYSGVLADKTGKTQFSCWHDFNIEENDVIRVEGGYVKMWRGIPQFNFDERAAVEILKDEEFPSKEELTEASRLWVEEIAERGGAIDATVRGILIDVKNGSGLIYRCPDCNRVLRKGTCRIHGEVDGIPDLRIKAVVDDGSGALTAIIGKELTETILSKSLEGCIQEAKEAMSHEVVRDELADILIAQPVELRGNVTSDDFGLMMMVQAARVLEIDIQEEARKLLSELEE